MPVVIIVTITTTTPTSTASRFNFMPEAAPGKPGELLVSVGSENTAVVTGVPVPVPVIITMPDDPKLTV